MTVVCSIAARGGSKGIPGKNLKPLANKPLIAHAIEGALNASSVDRVIVSTDDPEIGEVARYFGAEVPFLRAKSLADDMTPLLMVTKDTMLRMEKLGVLSEIVVQLAATCPFIRSETINESVEFARRYQSAVTLKKIEHEHPYRAKQITEEGFFTSFITDVDVESFQSRQDLPELFCTSGGIYTRTSELLRQATGKNFCFGPHPKAIIIGDIEGINIDRLVDFEFAEFIMSRKGKTGLAGC